MAAFQSCHQEVQKQEHFVIQSKQMGYISSIFNLRFYNIFWQLNVNAKRIWLFFAKASKNNIRNIPYYCPCPYHHIFKVEHLLILTPILPLEVDDTAENRSCFICTASLGWGWLTGCCCCLHGDGGRGLVGVILVGVEDVDESSLSVTSLLTVNVDCWLCPDEVRDINLPGIEMGDVANTLWVMDDT